MSKLINFRFFQKNDGTEINHNNHFGYIEDLQRQIESLQARNNELNNQVQHHVSRVYPDIQRVRDEQRIDRGFIQYIEDSDSYLAHLKIEQVTRIARKLLEENLIEHTFRPEEPNGEYISRMEIKVQTIL